MKPERRSTPRERPGELCYIQFVPEGGGIVVNASEQGLAFHAATALQQAGPIHLSVSPHPMEQIKLTAEVAWMDEAKKSGGLRFTELAADVRRQVRQWLTETSESGPPSRKFAVPPCAGAEETSADFDRENEAALPRLPSLDPTIPSGPDFGTPRAPRSSHFQATTFLPVPFFRRSGISIFWPRRRYVLAAGSLVLLILVMPIFFSRNVRHEIGNALIRAGEKLKANPDVQPNASSREEPAQISSTNSVGASSVSGAVPETSATDTADESDPAAPPRAAQRDSTDPPLSDRENAGRRTAGTSFSKGRSPLARQLWSALGAGDGSAELPLARLYLTGDGVPRNCDQARVLLRAASKKGNIEALQQLRQLNKRTCR